MDTVFFAINNGLAFLLGALIGLERQWRQRNAGLRTNALVALGSSLFVSLSMLMARRTKPALQPRSFRESAFSVRD